MRILVLDGPNMNLLGRREPKLYGTQDYAALRSYVQRTAEELGVTVELLQSNHEGALVDAIQDAADAFDGILLNPAAYTHTSIAIRDALLAVGLPTVEVHLTDLKRRELFRRVSYVRTACLATVQGKGFASYGEGLRLLVKAIEKNGKVSARVDFNGGTY